MVLIVFYLIRTNSGCRCIFTRNVHVNGVEQQFQIEGWGADSIRIRLSPDVIFQTPDYQTLLPEKPILDREDYHQSNENTFINRNIQFLLNDDNQNWSFTRQSDGLDSL